MCDNKVLDMNRIYAAISADIVSSTSLSKDDFIQLTEQIKKMLDRLAKEYDSFWGRLVHGDSIECVIENPKNALRIALLLKTFVKSFEPYGDKADTMFEQIDLRLAIGIGRMRTVDKNLDVMDGDAIYLSGRALASAKNIFIDNFQLKVAPYISIISNYCMTIMVQFLVRRIEKATRRQCKTLFYRLQCYKDNDVAKIMGISRAEVNNNLQCLGWDLIEHSIILFENYTFKLSTGLFPPKESQNPTEKITLLNCNTCIFYYK